MRVWVRVWVRVVTGSLTLKHETWQHTKPLYTGSTHVFEQGSNVGCHQQYSRALRRCQLPCHGSSSQVGPGRARIGGGKTWGWEGGWWGCQQTQAGKCVLKTAYKAGDVSEEAELRRLGWSIFFRACTRESRCTGSSVGGGSLLPVALVPPLRSHHQKVSAF